MTPVRLTLPWDVLCSVMPERFTSKVEPGQPDECWLWVASTRNGYGQFSVGPRHRRKMAYAHRLAFEATRGAIPSGHQIDHLCRTPRCVNPNHLEAVTPRVNTMRGKSPSARHARKTHCPQGHPYEGDNLYVDPNNGWRQCQQCRDVRRYESYHRRKND
jgi:hypothetical protein